MRAAAATALAAVAAALGACAFDEKTLVDPDAAPVARLDLVRTGPAVVRSTPAGIDCGTTCAAELPQGDVVLTPTLDGPGQLLAWGGACADAGPTCTVSLTTDRAATASFCGFGAWTAETVRSEPVDSQRYPAIAVLPKGNPVVAYYDSQAAGAYVLLRRKEPGSWISEGTLAPLGFELSLAIDPTGRLHALFRRATANRLLYVSRSPDGVWGPEEVVELVVTADAHTDLAVDAVGGVHVSYAGPSDRAARYAYRPPTGGWTTYPIGNVPEVEGVTYTSIALDEAGNVYVTYATTRGIDATDSLVHQSKGPGASDAWTKTDIETADKVGEYSSIAVGRAGDLHVSYYDGLNGDLRYATRPAGSAIWTRSTVEQANNVGVFSELALDRSGGVHITYLDLTLADLRYAYKPPGGTWTTTSIEASGTMNSRANSRAALALAPSGVHVAFRDVGPRYAQLACVE